MMNQFFQYPTEEKGEPFLLTFIPDDNLNGNKIIKNHWIGDTNSWDTTTEGNTIVVREKLGKIILEIENVPNDRFILHKIDINYRGFKVQSKTVNEKTIGTTKINEEKIITIINPNDTEIARLGGAGSGINEIRWNNALEIVGEYMNENFSNVTWRNGNLTMLPNPGSKISLIDNNLSGGSLTYGVDGRVRDFITTTNLIFEKFQKVKFNKNHISPVERKNFRTQLKILKHTFLINQLKKDERQFILDLAQRL
jgi:hypothetical protein